MVATSRTIYSLHGVSQSQNPKPKNVPTFSSCAHVRVNVNERKSMAMATELMKLTDEELDNVPQTDIRFIYSKNKLVEKLTAVLTLDSLLRIEFELDPIDDRALLMQAHGLSSMPATVTLPKKYALVKGTPKTGHKAKIEGSKYYYVELLIAPRVAVKSFLNQKKILYVQNDKLLDAKFEEKE